RRGGGSIRNARDVEGEDLMGVPIARVFGIEIRVQLGWVIILALIAVIAVGQLTAVDPKLESAVSWVLGGLVAFGFFVSSVSHDLAHALVARRRGVDVHAIGIAILLPHGDVTGAMVALTGWFLVLSANAVRDRVRLDDLVGGHLVSEAMEPTPATVHPSLTVDTFAAQLLDGESPVTTVPVVQGDDVVGLLGVGQVRRLRPTAWASTRVEDVMAKPPRLTFLSPADPLKGALERIQ